MLLSGGVDSATCLYLAIKEGYGIRALTFVHSGVTRSELKAAKAIARSAGVKLHKIVRLPYMKEADRIRGAKFEGLPPTYIPMRNSVFYSIAAGYAEEVRADCIIGGHNRDDAEVFRDVRPEFFSALQRAFRSGSRVLAGKKTRLLRPLRSMTKARVVRTAASLGVPLELTWSCHGNGTKHCWRCSGCLARLDSFRGAGVVDPLHRGRERGKLLK